MAWWEVATRWPLTSYPTSSDARNGRPACAMAMESDGHSNKNHGDNNNGDENDGDEKKDRTLPSGLCERTKCESLQFHLPRERQQETRVQDSCVCGAENRASAAAVRDASVDQDFHEAVSSCVAGVARRAHQTEPLGGCYQGVLVSSPTSYLPLRSLAFLSQLWIFTVLHRIEELTFSVQF